MKLLAAILLLTSTAQADWQSVMLRDVGDREYTVMLRINGVPVECLFDTGASAPQNGIWLRRDYAAARGFRRLGGDYHYYEGLTVAAGSFRRSGVLSYEYSAIDHPCLVGLSFFKGKSKFFIDLNTNRLSFK